jgi:hypothetical protein
MARPPSCRLVLYESGRLVAPRPPGNAPPTFEAGAHELTEHELGDFCAALADP